MIVVVMGVSGAGKTTVGRDLAARLGFEFAEGDAFHPPANVAKMRRGEPLGDADRAPWLDAMARHIDRCIAQGRDVVLACSALKRAYRTRLIGRRDSVRLVHLAGDAERIRRRLEGRRGHYMPAALLDSQFRALEPPRADESAIVVGVEGTPDEIVLTVLRSLGHPGGRVTKAGREVP